MNVLVTGATGSIGREIVAALCAKNIPIAILVRDFEKGKSLFSKKNVQKINIIDFAKESWVNEVTNFSPTIVIHLAALLTSKDDLDLIPDIIESNITFGAQLLQCLKQTNFELFINTGTCTEYAYGDGQPSASYLYSASKTAFRSIIDYYQQSINFRVVNVIPYTVYGQEDTQPKVIDIIYRSFFNKQHTNMSGGQQTLDFVHIEDVVSFYCLLIERYDIFSTNWEEYHLGTGVGSKLRKLAQLMATKLDLPEMINWGALPYRNRDTMYSVAPIAKIINHFNWSPEIDLEKGVEKYLLNKKPN